MGTCVLQFWSPFQNCNTIYYQKLYSCLQTNFTVQMICCAPLLTVIDWKHTSVPSLVLNYMANYMDLYNKELSKVLVSSMWTWIFPCAVYLLSLTVFTSSALKFSALSGVQLLFLTVHSGSVADKPQIQR